MLEMSAQRSIVHFILDHRIGGPHVYYLTLKQELSRQYSFTLTTGGSGEIEDHSLCNLRAISRLLYPIEILVNALLICRRFCVFGRPQGFHVHGAANIAPLLAAAILRIPVVWHFHETLPYVRYFSRVGKLLLTGLQHRIASVAPVSHLVRSGEEVALIPGMVDTAFWYGGSSRSHPPGIEGAQENILRLVSIANLNPLKGIDVLIEALGLITVPCNTRIEVEIIGASLDSHAAFSENVKAAAKRLEEIRTEIAVRFSGPRTAEYVRSALDRADFFILASRSEACPIALLEAMSMGKACLVTDVGYVKDMVPHSQLPFVVLAGSVSAISDGLNRLISIGRHVRLAIGNENRSAAASRFSPAAVSTLVADLYESLVRKS